MQTKSPPRSLLNAWSRRYRAARAGGRPVETETGAHRTGQPEDSAQLSQLFLPARISLQRALLEGRRRRFHSEESAENALGRRPVGLCGGGQTAFFEEGCELALIGVFDLPHPSRRYPERQTSPTRRRIPIGLKAF